MKAPLIISFILFSMWSMFSQELNEDIITFKDTRIVNSQSSEIEKKGFLKFIISHRFGAINDAFFENFFGLDNAQVRLGLDYGLSDRITIGTGRSTLHKTFDGFLKWKLLAQSSKCEFTLTTMQSIVYRQNKYRQLDSLDTPLNRLSYSTEIYLSRLFGDRIAVQLTPTLIYRNLVEESNQPNAIFSQGLIIGYKFSHKVAINLEYFYTPSSMVKEGVSNPLSIGIDIGTNGHVFQLFFSNSYGMNAPQFISETTGTWQNRDVFFGFNVSRVFRIKAFQ